MALRSSEQKDFVIKVSKVAAFVFASALWVLTVYHTFQYENALRVTYAVSKKKDVKHNLLKIKPYQKILAKDEFYWATVAQNFFKAGSYKNAKKATEKAIDISYDYRAFGLLAEINNNDNNNNNEAVVKNLLKAQTLVPGLLLPKYNLFLHYKSKNDVIEATFWANEIINHNKKGEIDISYFKHQANKYLLNEK